MSRPNTEITAGEQCVPNISRRGRTRRLNTGIIVFAATLLIFLWLVRRDAPAPWFLLVAPLAAYGSILVFQAKEQTCIVLSPRGLRETEDGRGHVRMAEEWLVAVRRQARKVWIESVVTTVLVTAAAVGYALLR